jgi:hypothetical protein
MHRTEAEFCRQQAERLLKLAQQCVNAEIRDQITILANEWANKAKAKESLSKVTLSESA